MSVQKTFLVGPDLQNIDDDDDQIVFIKGQYLIDRSDKDDYTECDTDQCTLMVRKKERVDELASRYHIDEPKLDRKVALCVVVPFCLVSFIHYMTRFAIAVAAQDGMKETLKITELQYSIASSVFFVPYVIFELLSNLLLKYVRPHYFMSFYIFMLGMTIICNGFVTNFAGLVVCRMFTGMFQSNSSALYYILANYYPNFTAQKMFTAYFTFGSVGGVLSFMFSKVADKINLLDAHWRWIFIIEGCLTCCSAFILFFTIPDFPEGARFLTDDETIFLVKKLEVYSGRSGYQLRLGVRDLLSVLKDSLLWWGCFIYLGLLFCSYGYGFFEPSIVHELSMEMINDHIEKQGASPVSELVLQAIPFILAFVVANVMAWISDYFVIRSPFIFVCMSLAFVGLVLIDKLGDNKKIKYIGCTVCIVSLSSAIPMVVCWVTLNFGGHLRKNVATAWLVSFCSTSGIFSTFLFQSDNPERFSTAIWTLAGFLAVSMMSMCVYLYLLIKENRKKTYTSYRDEFNNFPIREKTLLGDKSPSFKYLY